jgi:hypothetical protein
MYGEWNVALQGLFKKFWVKVVLARIFQGKEFVPDENNISSN